LSYSIINIILNLKFNRLAFNLYLVKKNSINQKARRSLDKYFYGKLIVLAILAFWPSDSLLSQDYYQQEVNYKLNVTLDDRKHELNAFESIEYVNNSPDTLTFLYFHLWPNAYSNNNTALARELLRTNGKSKLFSDPELKGYIDSLDFSVNGNKTGWSYTPDNIDICKIDLKDPLKPGDTIFISTPFHIKIPNSGTSRMGHSGESYQISQWYPKPAVYDGSGWHEFPYLNQGEFYSEYGSFEVTITLPDNYTVGASGDLQNEDEKKRLDKLAQDYSWITAPKPPANYFPPSSGKMKTLIFKRDHIHDFAWFADKRFHVMKGTVKLPESGREITTWAMFTDQESQNWLNAIEYIISAILDFSKWIGDYPYNNYTAVQSSLNYGSGMEYPGLSEIAMVDDAYLLEEVLAHEICHSWFYSAVGSDERRFPFMDESIVSAYESRYMEEKHPDEKLWEIELKNEKLAKLFRIADMPARRIQELDWLTTARQNLEQPLNLPATEYSSENYGSMIYSKGALGFNYLRFYLGNSSFDSIMKSYYQIWKNRHPLPDDLRDVFESGSHKDLSWFFDDFLGNTQRLDYKIARLHNNKLIVKNRMEMSSPVFISGFGDSLSTKIIEDGFPGKKRIDISRNNFSLLKIDPDHRMPEINRFNNTLRTTGIFRRSAPLQLQFLYTVEDPERRSLIYLPAVSWTRSDGIMVGVALNNGTLLLKSVEYSLIPLFAFRNNSITGYGKISFNITPYNTFIRLASFSGEAARFGALGKENFRKYKAGLDAYFRQSDFKSDFYQRVFIYYTGASDLVQIEQLKTARLRSYLQLGYSIERSGLINPYSTLLSFESGKSYRKISLEFNYRFSYYGKRRGLDARFFAGTMIGYRSAEPFYSFAPGGRSGHEQYLYTGFYPDRFTHFPATFWSRQMNLSEGGLVTPVNDTLGYSRWLCSISFSSSLPAKIRWLPVKPFLTILLNDHGITGNTPSLFFETGLKTGIWGIFEIFVPFLVSENIRSVKGPLRDRVRFILNLDILDPGKVTRLLKP